MLIKDNFLSWCRYNYHIDHQPQGLLIFFAQIVPEKLGGGGGAYTKLITFEHPSLLGECKVHWVSDAHMIQNPRPQQQNGLENIHYNNKVLNITESAVLRPCALNSLVVFCFSFNDRGCVATSGVVYCVFICPLK